MAPNCIGVHLSAPGCLPHQVALQERLADVMKAEGALQVRLEESLANESRLLQRLQLAQEGAQAHQRSLDAAAAAESELRAQLEAMRASRASSDSGGAAAARLVSTVYCEVLGRALREAEGQVVDARRTTERARQAGREALAEAHATAQAEAHAAAQRAADATRSEAGERVAATAAQIQNARARRLSTWIRQVDGQRLSWGWAEWRAAVALVSRWELPISLGAHHLAGSSPSPWELTISLGAHLLAS